MRSHVRSNWSATILVCGKCSKKLKGGFGDTGQTPLVKALRALGGGKKRKAAFGVIETRCFGICPKGAVVVVDAAHPGAWHLLPQGMAMTTVAETLGLAGEGADAPERHPGEGQAPELQAPGL